MKTIQGLILVLMFCVSCINSRTTEKLSRFEFEHKAMGSLFRIVCYSNDEDRAITLSQTAFALIDSLNSIMSDYLSDSELNRLSSSAGTDQFIQVSIPLYDILAKSKYWSSQSNGAFDITIGSLTRLWRRAGRQQQIPDSLQIQAALQAVDFESIELDSSSRAVKLHHSGCLLDLGGIAKGYAIDKAFMIFQDAGISRVLVDGAGDIRVGDPPPGKEGWIISVESISNEPTQMMISNVAIATSGDIYRYVMVGGIKYSHIIDPKTGYGVTIPRTVTVLAENATSADAMASIISVTGPKPGFNILKESGGISSLVVQVEEDGDIRYYDYGNLNMVK